jgi:type III restriction enzyme
MLAMSNGAEEEDDDGDGKALTRRQQAELLRRMVDSVGKPGEPGAKLQHVISVAMLSEGWDARTVTHIMGLRAFTSQLLCEQVVGRGLRRTSYDIANPMEGTFQPEYVNVFGVPFAFMPHEEEGDPPPPPPPTIRIEALAERAEQHQISWPQVVRIEHILTPKLAVDWNRVELLTIDAAHIMQIAELAPAVDGQADVTQITEISLRDLAERFRYQKLVFEAARTLFEEERPAWRGNTDRLFGQLIAIVEEFVRSDRLAITPRLFAQSDIHRRVLLALSVGRIVQHIKAAVRENNSESTALLLDEHWPIRSTGDMRPWHTSRPSSLTKRSHINRCVHDGTWEAYEAGRLDSEELRIHVAAWAKNDHLGFEVRYIFGGGVASYRPDFLIRLHDRQTLVLEVKGQERPRDKAKRAAMREWVNAVNADGRFGRWCCDVSREPADIHDVLRRHATGAVEAASAAS